MAPGAALGLQWSNLLAIGGPLRSLLSEVKQPQVVGKRKDIEKLADDDDVVSIVPSRAVGANLLLAQQTTGGYVAPSCGLSGSGFGIAVIDPGLVAAQGYPPAN